MLIDNAAPEPLVFLLDVDDTLLDNDRFNAGPATTANVVATLTTPNPLLSIVNGRIVESPFTQ